MKNLHKSYNVHAAGSGICRGPENISTNFERDEF